MKKVAIFTSFDGYDPSYSLILVAEDQIKMLVEAGHKPVVVVNEGFKPEGAFALPEVILEPVPRVTASNEGVLPDVWQDEVSMLSQKYISIIEKHDINVAITHDFISQPAALVHNLSGRKAGEAHTEVHWLHWVHSVFSSNVQSNIQKASEVGRSRWPNSHIVFPNEYDRTRIARNFNVEETDVLHCPHPTDIAGMLDMHPVLRRLFREKNLYAKKVIMVYPCRLDRGKQPHLNIELAAALKRLGVSVCFICVDFSSTGGDKVTYRDEMKMQAIDLGLDDTDVVFLSEFDKEFVLHAPRTVICSLFTLSNVFMLPSRSETYSLVAQEAALLGNLMIMNFDFPPMRSIYGETPKYYKFSGNMDVNTGDDGETNTKYHPNISRYFDDVAGWVKFYIEHDRAIKMKTWARTERSLTSVYKKFLGPMLNAE